MFQYMKREVFEDCIQSTNGAPGVGGRLLAATVIGSEGAEFPNKFTA